MPKPTLRELEDVALERWGAGDFERAAELYAQVIPAVEPDDYNLPMYFSSYASVLAELGRHDEARAAYERSVATELALGSSEGTAQVSVARYFLAEHALRVSDMQGALDAIQPSLFTATKFRGLLHLVKAEAHARLGQPEAARAAALVALAGASTPEQLEKFRVRLRSMELPTGSEAG